MRPSLLYLVGAVPAWFSIETSSEGFLVGSARVPKTPWETKGLRLRIVGEETPRVLEEAPGTGLPIKCPERHIQGDQTFCLGLRYLRVDCELVAQQWWEQLKQFLICQGVAALTGRWPVQHTLDHGEAGEFHERALALADKAGVAEEYASARLDEPSWLTDPKLRLFDRKGRAVNGRGLCPRGCTTRARGRYVKALRRSCAKRQLLVELAYTESLRRQALDHYWKAVFASGEKCCGTMRDCPLASHQDQSESDKT